MDEGRKVLLFILAPFETFASDRLDVMKWTSNARFKQNSMLESMYNRLKDNLMNLVSDGFESDSILLMDYPTSSVNESLAIATNGKKKKYS